MTDRGKMTCPDCLREFTFPAERGGHTATCPGCRSPLRLPVVAAHAKKLQTQKLLEKAAEEEETFRSRFEESAPEVFQPAAFSLFCGVIALLVFGALMMSQAHRLNLWLAGIAFLAGMAGLLLALFALITLRMNSQVYKGKWFAIAGLLVSTLFGILLPWAPARASWQTLKDREKESVYREHIGEIALGHFKFSEKHGHLPDDLLDPDGKPLLSWRVAILPFVGETELYNSFKLDEPWDSEANARLVALMPGVFFSASSLNGKGDATFQHLIGENSLYGNPDLPPTLETLDKGDGRSNTLLLVEADLSVAVPWTRPADLVVDPEAPLSGLRFSGLAAFADGTVVRLPNKLTDGDLTAYMTVSGGEKIGQPDENSN